MLIVGGLIALGIVALLAAFFLARGGGNGKGDGAAQTNTVPTQTDAQQASPEDGQTVGSQLQPQPQTPQGTTPGMQRQLYELVEQIQMLQVQSREIEQRLQRISVVLDYLDQLDHAELAPDRPTTTIRNTPRTS